MIRACEKSDFKMVSSFLSVRLCGDEIKFRLKDREFAEECEGHADTCGEWVRSNTKMMSGEFLRRPKGFLNYYRILFASSTPVYLLAKFQNVKNTTMVNSDKGDTIMFSAVWMVAARPRYTGYWCTGCPCQWSPALLAVH